MLSLFCVAQVIPSALARLPVPFRIKIRMSLCRLPFRTRENFACRAGIHRISCRDSRRSRGQGGAWPVTVTGVVSLKRRPILLQLTQFRRAQSLGIVSHLVRERAKDALPHAVVVHLRGFARYLVPARHEGCLPHGRWGNLLERFDHSGRFVAHTGTRLNTSLSHLGDSFSAEFFAVQPAYTFGKLADATLKHPLAKRPKDFHHEDVTDGFWDCLPCSVFTGQSFMGIGDILPFFRRRPSAKIVRGLVQELAHVLRFACAIRHGTARRRTCRYAGRRHKTERRACHDGCAHGSERIGHGCHGVCNALKRLTLVFLDVLCPFFFPGCPFAQGFLVAYVNVAKVCQVAESVSDAAGYQGNTF